MYIPVSVPGIPVWYQDSFFIALTVMGLAAIFLIISTVLGGSYKEGLPNRFRWNTVDSAVVILLVYVALRQIFPVSITLGQSTWVQIAFLSGIYFIGRGLYSLLDKKSIPVLIAGILMVGIGQAVYGLGQLYGFWPSHHGLFPLTGSFFNPGPYSCWLACMIPVAVYTIMPQGSTILRVSGWIFLFLVGAVLIPAGSRAGILAALGGAFIVLWPRIKTWTFWKSKGVKIGMGAALIILLTGLYFLKRDSADGRLLIWKVSTEMIADNPLFGVGWDRFPVMYNQYQSHYFNSGKGSEQEQYLADYVNYPFNELVGWTAEMGIMGIFLLLVIGGLLFYIWRQKKKFGKIGPVDRLVLSLVVTWSVFAFFSYPSEVPALTILGVLAFAALVTSFFRYSESISFGFIPNANRLPDSFTERAGSMALIILIAATAVYGRIWNRQYKPVSKEWISANANYQLGSYSLANEIYLRLWSDLQNEGAYLQFAGKSLSMTRNFYQSAQYLERALYFSSDPVIFTTLGQDYTLFGKVEPEKMDRAEKLLQEVKYMQPSHYYPRYLLMELYERMKKENYKREEASGILTLDTKVDSEAVQEIRMKAQEIVLGDPFETKIENINIQE